MHTVEIPGGTAEIRDRADIKERQRRLVQSAAMAASSVMAKLPDDLASLDTEDAEAVQTVSQAMSGVSLSAADANLLQELQDATIVALLASWTLAEPLPTLETVLDLDTDLYDALAQATKDQGVALAQATDFTPDADKASPTTPSSGSDGPLRADTEQPLTPESSGAGESTATASSTPA